MARIARLPLLLATKSRLDAVSDLTAYTGDLQGQAPPVKASDTPGVPDPSGRVAPYAVLYASPGSADPDGADLADTHEDVSWLIQVNVVAGFLEDLIAAADRVDGALYRWAPVVEGVGVGWFVPPLGYDAGTARRNDVAKPVRHWLPLQYRLTATR